MAKQKPVEILFPVGRMVQGDLYKANDKDADGNPLVFKHGPDVGKPRIEYYFAVAYAKDGRQWWETEWGQKIFAAGTAGFPNGQSQSPTFAWKVKDGDSTIPNKKGKRNCDRVGFPGHWIVPFSSGFPPDVYDAKGSVQLNRPDQIGMVKNGYFVQVFGNVAGNGSDNQPGVFLNYKMVAFAYGGEEISSGPDASAVGFGVNTARPAGAIDAPAFAANPYAGAPGAMPGPAAAMPAPAMPGPAAMPGMPSPAAAMPAMPAPVAVTPHAGYMAAPGPAAMPGMPAAPGAPAAPAPAVKSLDDRRTQSGMAYPVAAWITSGWTEQTLIAAGHLLPY